VAHTGKDLCPACAARLAKQLGLSSLWEEPRPGGIPLDDRRLRTGEVRRLRLADIDWERRLARIEQS
jgi:hypothetical protein